MATNSSPSPGLSLPSTSALPPLRRIDVSSLNPADTPVLRIKTDEDVEAWKQTRGYQDYGLFLRRLAESVVGCSLPYGDPEPDPAAVAVIAMLDKLDKWIDEIPPLPTPQRFGNLAFRTWGKRLGEESTALLKELLPSSLHTALPFIEPYLLTSFGSFTRMDYGTGHETSFALFLLCLTLLRFLEPEPRIERQLVLNVFVRYLRLCWRLQDVYKLEPAGSHGVWGLDDYSFLSYIFGSAQLRDQKEIPVNAILQPPLPSTNLYFLSITRIHEVKSGPFHEHSSQLYSIATGVQHWSKVHTGLFKMYEAEVLGKRVVVQHIPLGGLLEWDAPQRHALSTAPTPAPFTTSAPSATPAPWATAAPLTMSTPYTAPSRGSPLPFTSSVAHTGHPGTARYPQRGPGANAPLIPARMPLGPTASTALRPLPKSSGTSTPVNGPPPPPPQSSHSKSGAGGEE
ncbi:PTPA-domain-containing protein [Lentinus brumalis]|uniref:Serine/threonine-protein phosphatase 2A activator n=1 Tax=Lentinus brumalis TaxID=2498619 RepID=A0A371D134_9APHY|nr:PTPA-domain-containing protein [Polyporus brumalis]